MKAFWTGLKVIGMAALGGAVGSALDIVASQYLGSGVPITGGSVGTAAAIGAITAVKGYLVPSPLRAKPVVTNTEAK